MLGNLNYYQSKAVPKRFKWEVLEHAKTHNYHIGYAQCLACNLDWLGSTFSSCSLKILTELKRSSKISDLIQSKKVIDTL